MTDITASNIARGDEPGLASPFLAGLKWAHAAVRAFKAAAREGRLTDEACVRRIATYADVQQAGDV